MKEPKTKIWDKTWSRSRKVNITFVTQAIFDAIDHYAKFRGKTALELGCGLGRLSYLALKNGAKKVTLMDFSQEALGLAKAFFIQEGFESRTRYLKKDIRSFKTSTKYDIVFSSGVLEHFSGNDFDKVLKNHIDAAKEFAIIVVPAGPSWNNVRCKKKNNKQLYGWWQPINKKMILESLARIKVPSERMIYKRFDFLYQFPFNAIQRNKPWYRYLSWVSSFLNPTFGGLAMIVIQAKKD